MKSLRFYSYSFNSIILAFILFITQAWTARGLNFNVSIVSLTNHNTSAFNAYNAANFRTNFLTPATSDVDTNFPTEDSIPIDTNKTDRSLNPVTPGHVSKVDVHTLIPSRPDLRWFAHATPWFTNNSSHIHIGLTNDSFVYVTNMIKDMTNRGFNGVVINWYGKGDITDNVTLKLKSVLANVPTNQFHYILMLDKGLKGTGGDTNLSNLEAQIEYCQTNYFTDPHYETEPVTNGTPILMFFGVRSDVGSNGMTTAKSVTEAAHGSMIWVEENTTYITEPWEDETFQWADTFDLPTQPPQNNPFNTNSVISEFGSIKTHSKKAFAAMCAAFNGTLTRSRGWSDGKYLPSSNGLCMVQRAAMINANIKSNFTRMQWVTWSDWEEGTAVEPGIENNVAVNGSVNSSGLLSWSITSGEPRTVHHFEVYAATNGSSTATLLLSTVSSNVFQANISQFGLPPATYSIYVDAVGLPCVRDHMSSAISFTMGLPAPTNLVASATNAQVNLSWNSVINATNYVISYGTNSGGPYPNSQNSAVSATSITGLSNGVPYFFVVTAQNTTNTSGLSSEVTATPLAAPQGVALAPDSDRIDLAWNPVTGATSYIVYIATAPGGPYTAALTTTFTSAAITGLADGTTYYFQIQADNGNGASANSALASTAPTVLNTANFTSQMQVALAGYNRVTALTNFPLLVELSTNIAGFSYSQLQSGGTDLRFTDANGAELSYEINQWNTNGVSTVWVLVPRIASSNDFVIAYWGNPALSSPAPWTTNASTWNSYSGVFHFEENGLPYNDRTLLDPITNGTPPSVTSGMIGNGQSFNGSSQFLTPSGAINLSNSFSLSAWVNLSLTASNIQTIWASKVPGGNSDGIALFVNSFNTADGELHLEVGDGNTNIPVFSVPNMVPTGGWHHVFATADANAGIANLYVDGVNVTSNGNNAIITDFNNNSVFNLGTFIGNNNFFFEGTMDEPRIEPLRSADWVWATWLNVASNSLLTTYSGVQQVLAAPSGLAAESTNSSVSLTWNAVSGASSYTVLMATVSAGPYSPVVTNTTTSAAVTSLSNGTQYFFEVTANNGSFSSVPSSPVSATPLAAPESLSAFGTNAAVNLNWPSVTGATGYIISYGSSTGGPYPSTQASGGTSTTVSGFVNGAPAFFVVEATNANGLSAVSTEATATPLATPGSVTAQATNASVTLTWTGVGGATGYLVLYGTTSGGPYSTTQASAGSPAVVNGLQNGTPYFFVIEATNVNGLSAASSEVSASPIAPAQTLIPTDYSRSMKITFAGYNRSTAVSNFPVLVQLSSNLFGFSYNQFMSPTANDLRFTDASGNVLNHEIDQWNTNGVSSVWVQVPFIAGNSNYIIAYWGDRADSNTPAFTTNGSTWSGFSTVMHLKEGGLPYADSTTLHPATSGTVPAVTASGEIGSAETFNGASQFLAPSGAVNLGNSFSLSAWVNLSTTSTNIQTVWANKASGTDANGVALFINFFNTANGQVLLETGNGAADFTAASVGNAFHTGGWHHLFAAVDRGNGVATLYVDSLNVTSSTNTLRTDFGNNTNFTLGSYTNSSWFLKGSIDEARIEPLRSADWVWATWMNIASNSLFETYGPITLTKVLDQDAFTSSMKLVIAGYNRSSTLTNFPLLINLNTGISGFAYNQFASSAGNDLRFTDASGQILLNHEIDTWNTNGTSSVWVQVPAISSSTNYIIAYWGNPALTGVASFTTNGATWSNYLAVLHLKESSFPYLDSTTLHTATNGTPPTQTSSGQIGNAEVFNGTTQFLAPAGAVSLGSSFSLSAWVKLDSAATNIQTVWANKSAGATSNGVALFVNFFNTANGQVLLETGSGSANLTAESTGGAVPVGGWHHVLVTADRGAGLATFYVDGVNKTSTTNTIRTDFGNNGAFNLGRYTNSNWYLKGTIDEARIEPFRSADWAWATWMNVVSNSTLVSYPSVVAPNVVVEVPPQRPQISVNLGANGLLLNWAQGSTQFTLYSSTNLINWSPVSNYTILPNGQVQVPTSAEPGTAVFYRLQSQ